MRWAWICEQRAETVETLIQEPAESPELCHNTILAVLWLQTTGSWRNYHVRMIDLTIDRWWAYDVTGKPPPDLDKARSFAHHHLLMRIYGKNNFTL